MYQITNLTDNTTTISDSVTPITVHPSGNYIRVDEKQANGFAAKIPATREDPVYDPDEDPDTLPEDRTVIGTQTVEYLQSVVYALPGHRLKGGEPVGMYRETPAVPVITELESDLEEAYELLYGGDAE